MNIRKINNSRISCANAYDVATTNPSFYLGAGDNDSRHFQNYLIANNLPGGRGGESLDSTSEVQNAATALIGRLSEYHCQSHLRDAIMVTTPPPGAPFEPELRNPGLRLLRQDTWKARHNLTLTLGLRYSLERPVYETQGIRGAPTVPLGTYFAERLAAANNGTISSIQW